MIAFPVEREEDFDDKEEWRERKRLYKDKLAQSVENHWGDFIRIDKKSDLCVYFYYHGLALLGPGGTFCFINSNSWLDVRYGTELQEFLLKNMDPVYIVDNLAKRTFAESDVNTVIVFIKRPSSPDIIARSEATKQSQLKFIAFKKPFEEVLKPDTIIRIDQTQEKLFTDDYRVFPKGKSELLEEEVEIPEEGEEQLIKDPMHLPYVGNKWGGKYLRAPDIYWTILEKGVRFLGRLSAYCDGERYLNTGGADGFLIITDVQPSSKNCFKIVNKNITKPKGMPFIGEIERSYLVPLIEDYTKADKRIEIHGFDEYCIVVKGDPTRRMQKYIEWGELQGYHRRSVTKNQFPWYKPTRQMLAGAKILVPRSFNDSFAVYYNPKSYLSLRFYRLHIKRGRELSLVAYLNTTLVALVLETLGNKSLGQGVLDFFMADFLTLEIPIIQNPDMEEAFNKIKDRSVLPVTKEYGVTILAKDGKYHCAPPMDRKCLDDIVFDELRLTQGERDAVYEAVIELVKQRLEKARSV
jgi:hypothetical protein